MILFFWIVDLLLPVTMVVLGLVFSKHPPKTINSMSGYRTTRSMASQEAWDFANRTMGKLWVRVGAWLGAGILISKLVVPIAKEPMSLIHAGVSMVVLIGTIPVVEKQLKEKFGNLK